MAFHSFSWKTVRDLFLIGISAQFSAYGLQVYCPPQKGSVVLEYRIICAGAAGSIKGEGAKILCCIYKTGRDNLIVLK